MHVCISVVYVYVLYVCKYVCMNIQTWIQNFPSLRPMIPTCIHLKCMYVCMHVCMLVYVLCGRCGRNEDISSGGRLRVADGIDLHRERGQSVRRAAQRAHRDTQSLHAQPLVRYPIHTGAESRLR